MICVKCNLNKVDKRSNDLNLCLDCYNFKDEDDAQQLLNETETEPFTPQERADLNIKKVVGK